MNERERDVLALIVTLWLLPPLVAVLGAPWLATASVAIALWPGAGVGSVMLYDHIRKGARS